MKIKRRGVKIRDVETPQKTSRARARALRGRKVLVSLCEFVGL